MKTKLIFNLSLLILFLMGCKKDPEKPSIKIAEVSNITGLTASVSAEVVSEGDSPVTERGFCWSQKTNPNLNVNDGKILSEGGFGAFSNELTGLAPGKLYYVRAYATNNGGTGYSKVVTFGSLIIPPFLKTNDVTSITNSSAISGGEVTGDGGAPVTNRGVCWSLDPNPTINNNKSSDGSGLGTFTSSITGLTANSAYFVRSYATNSSGTGYGPSVLLSTVPGISFNTAKQYGTMSDIDGNTYKTIQIGDQLWMAENLRVSRYRNGDTIPVVVDSSKWAELSSGASCHYNHNLGYMPVYGKLYNWHVIKDSRMIAPEGWHIPTEAEWETLISYLSNEQGKKLREKGTKHWKANSTSTNESGFTALPGGFRYRNLGFDDFSFSANWWSASENGTYATMFSLGNDLDDEISDQDNMIKSLEYKVNGYAIRCIKD